MRLSTKAIAEQLACTPQAINKAIRQACKAQGINVKAFGEPDPDDKRVRTFSVEEVSLILEYAPIQKPIQKQTHVSESFQKPIQKQTHVSETAIIPATPHDITPLPPVTAPSGLIVKSARPLLNIGINTLNVNLIVGTTTELDQQTSSYQKTTEQGFQALQSIIANELKADLQVMRSQNKNVVAGIQAAATVQAIQELISDQAQDSQVEQPTKTDQAQDSQVEQSQFHTVQ